MGVMTMITCANLDCEHYSKTAKRLCWACWLLRRDVRLDARLPQTRQPKKREGK
jgi:hypothetical protein